MKNNQTSFGFMWEDNTLNPIINLDKVSYIEVIGNVTRFNFDNGKQVEWKNTDNIDNYIPASFENIKKYLEQQVSQ